MGESENGERVEWSKKGEFEGEECGNVVKMAEGGVKKIAAEVGGGCEGV